MVDFSDSLDLGVKLGTAALGGLLVGVEREWSARDAAAEPRFAGVRTFLLLGLIGGLTAVISEAGFPAIAVALLAGSLLLIVAAYRAAASPADPDATTEVAAVAVIGLGFLAGTGAAGVASSIAVLTAFVLAEKGRIHGWVRRIPPEVLQATVRFAVLALVVLPLLPSGPFGPAPGFRPRELWALVLAFSGVSFSGYLALRVAGPDRGYGLAGVLGGIISSSAVTLSFSRMSRETRHFGDALAYGVVGACTVLYLRVAAVASVLHTPLGLALLPYLLPPFALGCAIVWVALRGSRNEGAKTALPENPLQLLPAIQMAVAFQLVLWALDWTRGHYGVVATGALLGLTDVDALTFSLARLAKSGVSVQTAAHAVVAGILANTGLKLALALLIGRGRFRAVAAIGIGLLGVSTAIALWLL